MRLTLSWLQLASVVGALQGLILACVLFAQHANRTANRLPAILTGLDAMRFIGAYYHHIGLRELPTMIAGGLRLKYRPETQIFGFGQLQKGWNVMDRLRDIDTPTLVLAGRDDFLFPPESQAILADRLPNARLEIIERAGHNPQQENPTAVIECIRDFLRATSFALDKPGVPGHSIAWPASRGVVLRTP